LLEPGVSEYVHTMVVLTACLAAALAAADGGFGTFDVEGSPRLTLDAKPARFGPTEGPGPLNKMTIPFSKPGVVEDAVIRLTYDNASGVAQVTVMVNSGPKYTGGGCTAAAPVGQTYHFDGKHLVFKSTGTCVSRHPGPTVGLQPPRMGESRVSWDVDVDVPVTETKWAPVDPMAGRGPRKVLSSTDVMEYVISQRAAVVGCAKALGPSDGHRTLIMTWGIELDGATRDVAVAPESEALKDSGLAACITDLVRTWKFPPHLEPQDPIRFPFKF